LIGWGTGQSTPAVLQTMAVTATMTTTRVQQLTAQGLTREWVVSTYVKFLTALQDPTKATSRQLLPRAALLAKILEVWPD
jgi:hypothetical protein